MFLIADDPQFETHTFIEKHIDHELLGNMCASQLTNTAASKCFLPDKDRYYFKLLGRIAHEDENGEITIESSVPELLIIRIT